MAVAKKKETNGPVIIMKPVFEEVAFSIRGTTPLITNPLDSKNPELPGSPYGEVVKGSKKKKGTKIIPYNNFINAHHWITEKPAEGKDDAEAKANYEEAIRNGAVFGFRTDGIKASIITGAYRAGLDVKMTELRGAFFLQGGTENATEELSEIVAPTPTIKEDVGRDSGINRAPRLIYRPMFENWEIPLIMTFQKDGRYPLQTLLNLVYYGGFVTGIGEWRPEKNGQFGMYEPIY